MKREMRRVFMAEKEWWLFSFAPRIIIKIFYNGVKGESLISCDAENPFISSRLFMQFFVYFFGWLECVCHFSAYVAHFVFLWDAYICTQRAATASRRSSNLATHLSQSCQSHCFLWVVYSMRKEEKGGWDGRGEETGVNTAPSTHKSHAAKN
jgi:hypothetical protein